MVGARRERSNSRSADGASAIMVTEVGRAGSVHRVSPTIRACPSLSAGTWSTGPAAGGGARRGRIQVSSQLTPHGGAWRRDGSSNSAVKQTALAGGILVKTKRVAGGAAAYGWRSAGKTMVSVEA